mmetsp:Transcript_9739/g.24222  ORF Transcript_9739/g.24222 Transcript_9739/m.24222 type:complete len:112 (+) Transcript_9739:214-549(+)
MTHMALLHRTLLPSQQAVHHPRQLHGVNPLAPPCCAVPPMRALTTPRALQPQPQSLHHHGAERAEAGLCMQPLCPHAAPRSSLLTIQPPPAPLPEAWQQDCSAPATKATAA